MAVSVCAGGGDGACGGGSGYLCNQCGYKFASAHPSAKQRRAHRKNCGGGGGGTPPPAAPAAAAAATAEVQEERQEEGKKLLLGNARFPGRSVCLWSVACFFCCPDAFRVSDLDGREGEAAAGGVGNVAGASDSGGGLPGSTLDVGNAVVDGDNGGLFRFFLPGHPPVLCLLCQKKISVIILWEFVR